MLPGEGEIAAGGHLTEREAVALQVLIDKRAEYRGSGHGLAAGAMGVAILLIWHVLKRVDCPESEFADTERSASVDDK